MPVVCFSSPKGGVGKTTITANVAGEFARAGRRVIALDLDPQNSLRFHFGVPLQETAGFTRSLPERPDWRSLLSRTAAGVELLAYGQSTMAQALALSDEVSRYPDLLAHPLQEILADPALILVTDTEPGSSPLLRALLPLVDVLVTVLQVDAASMALIPSIESGSAYGDLAEAGQRSGRGAAQIGFVLNMFDPRTRLGSQIIKSATHHLGARLLGAVYRDETIGEAVAAQRLVADYAPACKAAHDIAGLAETIGARLAAAPAVRDARI